MDIVDSYVSKTQKKMDFPAQVGDTLDVYVRFQEAGKERTQVFSGVVLKIQGKKSTRSFTVRKISDGVGVERTFPLAGPVVEKVKVISKAKVRRARLYYLRQRKGRSARLQTLQTGRAEKRSGSVNVSDSATDSANISDSASSSANASSASAGSSAQTS